MAWLVKSAFEPENSMKYMLDESETSEPPAVAAGAFTSPIFSEAPPSAAGTATIAATAQKAKARRARRKAISMCALP